MKAMQYIYVSFFFLLPTNFFAQKIDYLDHFLNKLKQMSLAFVEPTDSDYRDVIILKNDIKKYDFAIRSRKEKIEIRYILEVEKEPKLSSQLPDIQFFKTLTHLASNDENASPMAVHSIPENELNNDFQADWGKFAYFQPKGDFAHWRHAKLLALYKSGKGMVYVLFLFDKPTPSLNNRFYAVQFSDLQNNEATDVN